jgi:site-specific DNA-cytosine methylase
MGYTINAQILDASDFGVAQQRKRAFIVGIKIINVSISLN